ncbi:DsbA family oxidoreductase [Limibacter armeniacum]|uniref:DsbA family oxidoreductase n=1 Tax=Limibacter armeniacum TaxID=466084 RepID=UPI002FE514DD
MKKLKIDIVSDVVCPWCYIGNGRLEKALSETSGIDAEISWHPFQLHPDVTEGSAISLPEYLGKKYGQDPKPMIQQVQNIAKSEGLEMEMEKVQGVPNTVQAHTLMHFAREEGKDKELSLELFKAYFAESQDMEDKATLMELGKKVGLSAEALTKFETSEEGKAEVLKEESNYRMMGVNAVPTFIINDKYMIQGAQPVEVWKQAFEQVEGLQTGSDAVCGPDSCDF